MPYFSVQAQEEADFNPQSDAVNAYAESQAAQVVERIEIPLGEFGVVIETPAYCAVTDAMLPNPHRSLDSLFPTEELAWMRARVIAAQWGSDEWPTVWDQDGPVEATPASPVDYDDIPF